MTAWAPGPPQPVAHGVFVAGTDTGVGKTRVTVALLTALRQQGLRVAGMKPVAAGIDATGINEDAALIRAASSSYADAPPALEEICPYQLEWAVSPHLAAARAGITIHVEPIRAVCAQLARRYRLLLVEGTGGWLAPIGEQLTMAEVAAALGLPVVLVVGLRLGCLNHSLLTARAIAQAGLPLLGWIGSVIDPDMQALAENLATLERRLTAPRLGVLPFASERVHDAARLQEAAQALAGALPAGAAG